MIQKRSIKISGHSTSISLEQEFWEALKAEAKQRKQSVNALIAEIDAAKAESNNAYNLSSALRVFILKQLQTRSISS